MLVPIHSVNKALTTEAAHVGKPRRMRCHAHACDGYITEGKAPRPLLEPRMSRSTRATPTPSVGWVRSHDEELVRAARLALEMGRIHVALGIQGDKPNPQARHPR